MKLKLTIILLIASIACKAQKTNLGDGIITNPVAVPGAQLIVGSGTPKQLAYIAPPPASGTFFEVTINGNHQWMDLATLISLVPKGAVGATGATGQTGATGAQGQKGDQGDPGISGVSAFPPNPQEGQVLIFHNNAWQYSAAGVTIAQNQIINQIGSVGICQGQVVITEGHTIASTVNITGYTSGSLYMAVDYTDRGGVKRTQLLPTYSGVLVSAQSSISLPCLAGTTISCYIVCSPDWVGVYDAWANVHQF